MTGNATLRRNHTPLALCMIALTVWALSSVNAHGQTKTRPLPSAPPPPAKPAAVSVVAQKWTGDFDGMVQRRRIRIITPYRRTHYFIDKGVQRGIVYDAGVKHAGVKYIRFMIDEQFAADPADDLNKTLFAFAAYNCGPGRMRKLRRETESKGLNPNVWFNNVERTAGERVGRETVQYVSNIYKYYVAYTLVLQQQQEKDRAKQTIKGR